MAVAPAAPATLGERIRQRDAWCFVGRMSELALIDALLADPSMARVVLLHGPGGIGKSTLLREVQRRAERLGRTSFRVDGAALGPDAGALQAALTPARGLPGAVVLIDGFEELGAPAVDLRRRLLPGLAADAVVVIAGRRRPDPGWRQDGWERVTHELPLGGLTDDDALQLLAQEGIGAPARARQLATWAAGSPLALTLAADAARRDPAWTPALGESPRDSEIAAPLIARLVRGDLDSAHADVLAVAAITLAVTPDLLAAALPGTDAAADHAWLAARSFVDVSDDRVSLHDLVRRALRVHLRATDPERERVLRCRIADHLYHAALSGRPRLTADLAELVKDPAIRWGYLWDDTQRLRVGAPRADESPRLHDLLAGRGLGAAWPQIARFLDEAPEHTVIVRDHDERPAGIAIAVTPDTAPVWANSDDVLGPWLRFAARELDGQPLIVWRLSLDLSEPLGAPPNPAVQAMANVAATLRCGLPSPRYAMLPITRGNDAAMRFAATIGARHLPDLDVPQGDTMMECHLVDYGPGGLLAAQRAAVHREAGTASPAVPRVTLDIVREALRNLDNPVALASSPLASGGDPATRAAAIRADLERAITDAFGDGPTERLMHDILVRGYLLPGGHEAAALALHISRTTYFRRLRAATERLAEHVAAERSAR